MRKMRLRKMGDAVEEEMTILASDQDAKDADGF